jgi:hypothetical protein
VALRKIAALPKEQLGKCKDFLPILSICGMFFNASCFFQNYFTMAESKQNFVSIKDGLAKETLQIFNNSSMPIREINDEISFPILLYTAEYLTKIGGYLFNMTSALAWFDIVMR